MKKYRITFYNGPTGNGKKDVDVTAASSDEAMKMAYDMPEAKSRIYTDILVQEIEEGPKVIGLEVGYYDTVFKQNFTDYICIYALTEKDAIAYYNKHLKGGRFLHRIGEEVENGKCIRGEVKSTYLAACPGYDFDATTAV